MAAVLSLTLAGHVGRAATATASNAPSLPAPASTSAPPATLPGAKIAPEIATNSPAAGLINDYVQRLVKAGVSGWGAGTLTNPPSPGQITSSNLLTLKLQTSNQVFRVRQFQEQLEAARELRKMRDHRQAAALLIGILESEAPEEIKRPSLFELALVAQQEGQLGRAQQIFSQYVKRYHDDPAVPEILLRQGILYREMGVGALALSKFYAVLSSALSLRLDQFEYYQRLVLLAQTEIAETYFSRGQFAEAVEFYARLLRLDSPELNKERMHFRYLKCLSHLGQDEVLVPQAQDYLQKYAGSTDEAEVRFLLATSLKHLGRNREALQQVLALLEKQRRDAAKNPQNWAYWQQRTGNELANQLYQEGDYLNALEIYLSLLNLDASPRWQGPVLYQIGLVYEHMKQPERARDYYQQVLALSQKLNDAPSPGLKALIDMAQWRIQFLQWRAQAENLLPSRSLPKGNASQPPPAPAPPSPAS
ncbi:tetratricopeptide repeat protein [Fontisphaera persica]|uniref:tetratricopeptide repeat protein n=1 Tax=Fontisphaera persica TaxID=2974023 RepID=UPI0024BFCD2F|nr:tetratricopeptide repeat protein [Fontisphaera persica]WCJ58462.1 tetratricopeptide repeat protein [Fontisphaera persica]